MSVSTANSDSSSQLWASYYFLKNDLEIYMKVYDLYIEIYDLVVIFLIDQNYK